MGDLVSILQRSGGSARFADLSGLVSARSIRAALEGGQIRRVAKGVYALPEDASDLTVARANGGILSRESAALHHGFEVVTRPLLPHVTIGRTKRRRSTDLACILHKTADPLVGGSTLGGCSDPAGAAAGSNAAGGSNAADGPGHVPLGFGEASRPSMVAWLGKATSPLRTVLDCARFLPLGEALAIADSAVRSGKVQPEILKSAAEALRGAGRRKAIRVVDLMDGRSESALESVLRARLIEAGITGFIPQYRISGQGFSARVDLANPQLKIVLEADSFAFHGTRAALRKDCRRHVNLAMCGWLLLRYSWEDVILNDDWVGESLDAVISGVQLRPRRLAA
jgi:very-short-patch-repair endonuclease